MSEGSTLPDAPPLILAVSPYHLTLREPPAMASLLIADRVVTARPVPSDGTDREAVERMTRLAPNYRALLESWRWSVPLWQEGVIAASHSGEALIDAVEQTRDRIRHEPAFGPLKDLMREERVREPHEYLNALCADLLKGGPHPGLSLPMAAGIDLFAATHGVPSARSHPESVARKAEARLATKRGTVAVPVVLQGSAAHVLTLRRVLAPSLATLRSAVLALAGAPGPDPDALESLRDAAESFGAAYERAAGDVAQDPDDVRRVDGYVTLSVHELPVSAVLRAGLNAARQLGGSLPGTPPPDDGGRLITLEFKPMRARPTV